MTDTSADKFEWIKRHLSGTQELSRLSNLLPNQFDKYLLMPWIYGIIDKFPFNEYPEDFGDIDNLNHRHRIEKDFGIFLKKDIEDKYRQTTLKELSEKFSVQYCADTRYLIKWTPGVIPMLKPTIASLEHLIRLLTNDEELCFYIHDNDRFASVSGRRRFEDEYVIRDISTYIQFQKDTGWDSVSYLFPADEQWCICTLEDFEHLILCCNDGTYTKIEAFNKFETFEIGYSDVLINTSG